ncbi:hypothetical protein LK533_00815 [Sphingomonas sp. PL-96]|uniref:hypothetical protein n=1 Tax=Sphingomonas sp. PL-96 TaxID=2887201 RepID=UPI001E38C546|nr:hypothetical protein [Sphingomonas sp. PL-96]MCC2975214.1 hypothetical protein [Sphingomonas sp. PL-96]
MSLPRRARARQRHQIKTSVSMPGDGGAGSTLVQPVLAAVPDCPVAGEKLGAVFPFAQAHARRIAVSNRCRWGPALADRPWRGALQINAGPIGRRQADTTLDERLPPPLGKRSTSGKQIHWLSQPHDLATSTALLRFCTPVDFVRNVRVSGAVVRSGWHATLEDVAAAEPDHRHRLRVHRLTRNPDQLAPLSTFSGEPFGRLSVAQVPGNRLQHAGGPF